MHDWFVAFSELAKRWIEKRFAFLPGEITIILLGLLSAQPFQQFGGKQIKKWNLSIQSAYMDLFVWTFKIRTRSISVHLSENEFSLDEKFNLNSFAISKMQSIYIISFW